MDIDVQHNWRAMEAKRLVCLFFFFSSRRRHTRFDCDWSSDVCSSDLNMSADGKHAVFIRTNIEPAVYVADVHAKTREIGRLERLTHDEWQSRPYEWAPGDRKSTRLNSSHSQNSYAVFCLEKKKTSTPA